MDRNTALSASSIDCFCNCTAWTLAKTRPTHLLDQTVALHNWSQARFVQYVAKAADSAPIPASPLQATYIGDRMSGPSSSLNKQEPYILPLVRPGPYVCLRSVLTGRPPPPQTIFRNKYTNFKAFRQRDFTLYESFVYFNSHAMAFAFQFRRSKIFHAASK